MPNVRQAASNSFTILPSPNQVAVFALAGASGVALREILEARALPDLLGEVDLASASAPAPEAMTTSATSGEATLALIGHEEQQGCDSQGTGRSGHRQWRRPWAGHGSVHRGLVQPGRCTTDSDEMTKHMLDLISVPDNGNDLHLGAGLDGQRPPSATVTPYR